MQLAKIRPKTSVYVGRIGARLGDRLAGNEMRELAERTGKTGDAPPPKKAEDDEDQKEQQTERQEHAEHPLGVVPV